MSKKIMILGGSILQVPAITKAADMGLEVIVLDRNPDAPGMKLAHHAIPIDFMDKDQCLKTARRMKIDGVVTISSDLPVATVGHLCDHLCLPGITEEVGERCSNKVLMKAQLKRMGVPTADSKVLHSEEEAVAEALRMDYPLMVKAVDSSGSRGIIRLDHPANMREAYKRAIKHSRCGRIIAEAFLEGLEFGAQVFMDNGNVRLIIPHNDTLSPPPYYVPIGHSLPFRNNGFDLMEINRVIQSAIEALEIRTGAVNVDLIYTQKGPMIIEVGARFGGTCLPALVNIFTGTDLIKEVILLALGEKGGFDPIRKQPVAALLVTSPVTGVLTDIALDGLIHDIKGVMEVCLDVNPGDRIQRFMAGPDRIGHIITLGESDLEAEGQARMVRSLIRLNIRQHEKEQN